MQSTSFQIKVALAQIAPVWLDKVATTQKVITTIKEAHQKGADLVTFGETFLPGYPFWTENTDGARFNSPLQKQIYAYYLQQAVSIEDGDLDEITKTCKTLSIACYLGIVERANDRSGHSVYCSLVYIDPAGDIQSCHRKLMPTFEERLVWATGDGHGLRTHKIGAFTVGGLNCWENWMPLARTALYAQGEDLHIAAWPGGDHNTHDITRFIAKEARSFVVSVSALMRKQDIPNHLPFYNEIIDLMPDSMANGASCVASPTGEWLLEPQVGEEAIYMVEVDHEVVRQERALFDPTGHYSRPDVAKLSVNRERQSVAKFTD